MPRNPFPMQELLENNRTLGYVVENISALYDALHFIKSLNPFSAVNFIRKGVRYDDYLKNKAAECGRNAVKELEELEEIMQLAKGFETLAEWVEHIQNYDSTLRELQKNSGKSCHTDSVNLVTMHASKGLEWKVVILPDVNEGIVPHKKAVTDRELEEERRMFYVAMTRAKERLFLFYIKEDTEKRRQEISCPHVFLMKCLIKHVMILYFHELC